MTALYDRLILLNYQEEFIRDAPARTLSAYYFYHATNSGEQYYNFVQLAAWLIQKCNRHMEPPQESDDPNIVISKIFDHIRALVREISIFITVQY